MRLFLFFLLSLFTTLSYAQETGTIYGKVNGLTVTDFQKVQVHLSLDDRSSPLDNEGNFTFKNIPYGTYVVYAEFEGNSFTSDVFELNSQKSELVLLQLIKTEHRESLEGIVVLGNPVSEKLKNSAIKSEVVDMKQHYEQSNSVEEIMNKTPGIKIRNVGGLGSSDNIMIGAYSGNAVKFLYDNIPIDYLGSNYGLAKIPVNNLERVEIYKGVLPTKIGTDALGGAVNFVPDYHNKTTGSAAYETGSFGTHILSANLNLKLNSNFYLGTHTFYNRSKNDYEVDHLPFRDPKTGQVTYIRNRLFHNGFKQFSTEVFLQGRNLKWADLIEFKINHYNLHKDIQNDAYSRARPFGAVYRTENGNFIPSLKYRKYFLDYKLQFNQFLVISKIHFAMVDTLKHQKYDWAGVPHASGSASEMANVNFKNGLLTTDLTQMTSRSNISYMINEHLQIEGNVVANHYNRRSNADTINPNGANYLKTFSNLALNASFWEGKIESSTQIKHLSGTITGHSRPKDYPNQLVVPVTTISNQGWSVSQAIKYQWHKQHYIRAAYENTYRLPDQEELFGDNNLILPSYSLSPEKSQNINLGYVFTATQLRVEYNVFYRITQDLIRLKPINQYQAVYLNLDHVKGSGMEFEVMYQPNANFMINGNLTWNNYRLSGSRDPLLNNQHYTEARIANMPFYFTNLSAAYNFKNLLKLKNDLSLFWDYAYVHQYYLDFIEKQFEPDGFLGLWGTSKINTSRVIPVQHLQNLGLTYHLAIKDKHHISINGSVKNILNSDIYNEFKMQSPGRYYRLKLTYGF